MRKSSYQTMVTPSGVLLYVVCFCSMSLIMFFTLTPSALREKLTEPILVTRKKTKMTIFPSTRTTRSPNSYLLTPTERVNKNITISIIIVYTHGTPLEKYETALNSVECYAKLHSYPFYLFSDTKYEQCRKHKDLFFRRHCCIVRFMESQLAPDSWLLVLDGDIAVVNPNILIDTYIDPNYDITLFDRFFNFEVGANSYLVKNTKLGREFACGFADYELKLPKSFHGTDNGALHPYLVELLAPENVRLSSLCKEIWRKSTGYATLFEMEACTRLILGDRINYSEHKLRILPKGKAWVRDLWLLRSRWAEDDFMVHAVKEEQLDTNRTDNRQLPDDELYQWDPTNGNMRTFPLLRKLDISKCERGEEQWHYDSRLKITNEKKKKLLDYMERKILRKRLETIGRIAQRL